MPVCVIIFVTIKLGLGTITRTYCDGVFSNCDGEHLKINFELGMMESSWIISLIGFPSDSLNKDLCYLQTNQVVFWRQTSLDFFPVSKFAFC